MNLFLTNNFTKLTTFVSERKRILIPLIPLVFFILILIFVTSFMFTPEQTQENIAVPTPTSTTQNQSEGQSELPNESEVHGNIVLYEGSETLERKELRPDGSIKYLLSSDNPSRPHISIVTGVEQNPVFDRSVSENNQRPSLAGYINIYGQPERIIKGSKFYGSDIEWYLYPTKGLAFANDSKSDTIVEVHTFVSMSANRYIELYGEDLPQTTPGL